jgi:predicted Rossmann-fold nucleotide-binding protein
VTRGRLRLFLLAEGMIDPDDLSLFEFAETAQETRDRIGRWYSERGRSLLDPLPSASRPEPAG